MSDMERAPTQILQPQDIVDLTMDSTNDLLGPLKYQEISFDAGSWHSESKELFTFGGDNPFMVDPSMEYNPFNEFTYRPRTPVHSDDELCHLRHSYDLVALQRDQAIKDRDQAIQESERHVAERNKIQADHKDEVACLERKLLEGEVKYNNLHQDFLLAEASISSLKKELTNARKRRRSPEPEERFAQDKRKVLRSHSKEGAERSAKRRRTKAT
ncbi:MAG: hypothetical protein ACXWJZ_08165 [Burkholderiaceae bacterium]